MYISIYCNDILLLTVITPVVCCLYHSTPLFFFVKLLANTYLLTYLLVDGPVWKALGPDGRYHRPVLHDHHRRLTHPLDHCNAAVHEIKKCKRKGSLYSITERRFRSWSRFLAVSLQVTWVVTRAVGCHYRAYFPPSPQLPSRPLRGLLPFSLLGEHRHGGCEQFA